MTGAYEPPKTAKEHATTMHTRVPSKYKLKRIILPNMESARLLEMAIECTLYAWQLISTENRIFNV